MRKTQMENLILYFIYLTICGILLKFKLALDRRIKQKCGMEQGIDRNVEMEFVRIGFYLCTRKMVAGKVYFC